MRLGPVILAASLLVGCSTIKGLFKDAEPPAPPPPVVPAQSQLQTIGEKVDKADSRVAAAITVAVENKDKPPVVEAEGRLALSYLPKPSDDDLQFARSRAASGDQKAYEAQSRFAKDFLSKIDADWKAAETAAKKNADEIVRLRADLQSAKAENDRLKQEIVRVEEEASRSIWSLTGAGLAAAGALASAFLGFRVGIPILLCGMLAGATPHIMSSSYFPWIVGTTLVLAAGLGLFWLYDIVRDRVNASDEIQEKNQNS